MYLNAAESSDKCHLRIGWLDWGPYQYLAKNDKPDGFDIAASKALAKKLNCTVEFIFMPWERQHREAAKGNIDLILGVMPDRPLVHFVNSQRFRPDPMAFYWFKDSIKENKDKTLKELIGPNFKLGVLKWDYRSEELESLLKSKPRARYITQVNSIKGVLNNLRRKHLQGGVMHVALAEKLLKDKPITNLVVNKKLSYSKDVYIALALSSPLGKDFIHRINEALIALRNDGTYDELINRYLPSHSLVVDKAYQ